MDKTQLGEFIKSIDKDLEIKEGKQYLEVTVPPSMLYQLARQLREKEEHNLIFSFVLPESTMVLILVLFITSGQQYMTMW